MQRRHLSLAMLGIAFAALHDVVAAASSSYKPAPPPPAPAPAPRSSYSESQRRYGPAANDNRSGGNAAAARSNSSWSGAARSNSGGSTASALKSRGGGSTTGGNTASALKARSAGSTAGGAPSALANKAAGKPAGAVANASALNKPKTLAAAPGQAPRASAAGGRGSSLGPGVKPELKGKSQSAFNNAGCGPDQVWDPVTRQCVPKGRHHTPDMPGHPSNDNTKKNRPTSP